MTAQTVITHAPTQGVSLIKATDMQRTPMPRRLYLPDGTHGDSAIVVNLDKSQPLCDGCLSRPVSDDLSSLALYRSTDRSGWVTLMCNTHARRWGVMR